MKLVIDIDGQISNETEIYEYLGVMIDKSLTYTTQIERVYKKAPSRVKLLSRIRKNISAYVAETIYKVMIEPVLFYCNSVVIGISDSTAARFQKIQDRAHKVVFWKKFILFFIIKIKAHYTYRYTFTGIYTKYKFD